MHESAGSRCLRGYITSVVVLLATLASIKLVTALGSERILAMPDPVLSVLSVRQVVLCAAVMEALAALLLVSELRLPNKFACMVLLVVIFGGYKFAYIVLAIPAPCPCLGSLGAWLHLDNRTASIVSHVLLGYIGLPSVITFLRWRPY